MRIIDSQGRIFGKLSILDLGAVFVILLVIFGIFFAPGDSGSSIAQNTIGKKAIEVDVLVRGLSIENPQALFDDFSQTKSTDIIIRNQPYGQVEVASYKQLERTITVPQPDGTVKALPDPRPTSKFSLDMLLTLKGDAQITDKGAVLGNSQVKVGTPLELDGRNYNFKGSVIDVRY